MFNIECIGLYKKILQYIGHTENIEYTTNFKDFILNKYQHLDFKKILIKKKRNIIYSFPKKYKGTFIINYFLKDIYGKSYNVDIHLNDNWLDVKKKIEKKYLIAFNRQKIVAAGELCYDNELVDIHYICTLTCVHLIITNMNIS